MLGKQATKGEQKKQGRNERIGMGMTVRLHYISRRACGVHQKCQNKGGENTKKDKDGVWNWESKIFTGVHTYSYSSGLVNKGNMPMTKRTIRSLWKRPVPVNMLVNRVFLFSAESS